MADASISRTASSENFVPFWLPPGGHGNGLAAGGWAPIADLPTEIIDTVLDLLRRLRIPGYAAPAPRAPRGTLPTALDQKDLWRLWVASTAFAQAETMLVDCLPRLLAPGTTSRRS